MRHLPSVVMPDKGQSDPETGWYAVMNMRYSDYGPLLAGMVPQGVGRLCGAGQASEGLSLGGLGNGTKGGLHISGPPQRVEKLRHASQKCKHFFEGMQATARTSSGQSPHRSPRPDGQGSLRSLVPSLPNKPASLGFVWVPGSHTCGLGSVFSDVHAAGKHDLTLFRRLRPAELCEALAA